MPQSPLPPPSLRQLGRILRSLREGQRRRTADVAGELGWSIAKLSRIENGRTRIALWDLPKLLNALRVTDAGLRQTAESLLRASLQPGWWKEHRGAVSGVYAVYIELEQQASMVRAYESYVV